MNRKLRMYMYSSHLLPWNIESSELLFGFVVVDDNLRRHSFLADVLAEHFRNDSNFCASLVRSSSSIDGSQEGGHHHHAHDASLRDPLKNQEDV